MKARRAKDLDPHTVAIAALSHLATEPDELERFFALTGLGPDSLREAAGEPAFVESILDFVLGDDRLTLAVAAAQDVPPEEIAQVRGRLEAARMTSED